MPSNGQETARGRANCYPTRWEVMAAMSVETHPGSSIMRLFLGFPVPAALQPLFSAWQRQLRDLGLAARYPTADEWHLTLLFLGDGDAEARARIMAAVDRRWPHYPPATLTFTRLATLPPHGVARVLVAVPDRDDAALAAFAADVARALRHGPARFRPHVTLARPKGPVPGHLPSAPTSITWTLNHLVLFQSQLTPAGPLYHPLHAWEA
jgi:2'-5' RNA ligase